MNKLFEFFSSLPEQKDVLISSIIDNQKVLFNKEVIQTTKQIDLQPEIEYRTFESMCLTELGSKKMLEINAKQKETEMPTQVHYSYEELKVIVEDEGLIFITTVDPIWSMETRVLFK